MRKLIFIWLLISSTIARAEDKKPYNVVNKGSEILDVLSKLIQHEKEGLAVRTGNMVDLTALSLSGYQVVKITFRDTFGDGKKCTADLTFNKSDSSDRTFVSFFENSNETKRWTIFTPYCK